MKRSSKRKLILFAMAFPILIAVALGGWQLYHNRPGYGLPFIARFTPDADNRWTALGGVWEVADGSMRNDSNDRGGKLLTGLSNWKDYIVDADLQLIGSGSVGLVARVSEAEVGENSFKGYFAAIRDNSLVLGVFDFAYHEAAKVPIPDPIREFEWYHIRLKVEGCDISASVSAAGFREIKTALLNDPDCFRSGKVGLRSNGTGGIWRNVTVMAANSASTAVNTQPNRQPLSAAAVFQRALLQRATQPNRAPTPGDVVSSVHVQPVNSLQYLSPFGDPVASVRGSVVLIRPAVYVQDSTGGVEIQLENATPLKIGDEVEVTGKVCLDRSSSVIRQARVRLLRQSVPLSPAVLTANQVAEGHFDGRFVEVAGYLQAIDIEKDGSLKMDLDARTQTFHAILPPGRRRSNLQRLRLESRLRLRGISVVDPRFNKDADPFVILVRSAEDVEVVAGPPWWRPSTLFFASLLGLGLIFAFNHLYLLAKHWRLQAVADERERLAHEIHDTLAQSFAGIGFQLQAIRNSVPTGATGLEGQVDLAMAMARTSHGEARRSIATLHPKSLGHIGLLPALRECAERMVKNGNVTVETYGEDAGRAVPPRIKDTLFRIGQEAIANSIRHADPHTIRINFQKTQTSICLSIEDDGVGFTANSDHAGFGLLGMRKRAESISAALTVRTAPGSGTKVEVKAAARSHFLNGFWPRLSLSMKDI